MTKNSNQGVLNCTSTHYESLQEKSCGQKIQNRKEMHFTILQVKVTPASQIKKEITECAENHTQTPVHTHWRDANQNQQSQQRAIRRREHVLKKKKKTQTAVKR